MWHYLWFLSNESDAACVYFQVKRVMNGVFHSLRGEFDLSESYSGQAVLGVIVTTIKVSVFYTEMPKQPFPWQYGGKKIHLINDMFGKWTK